jgi:hypothetical protein
VFIGPKSTLKKDPKSHKYVVLHEMGHLFGVGDAYAIAGYSEPGDQPSSTMKETDVFELQNDDKAAIRAVWRFLQTGNFLCETGYRSFEPTANGWSLFSCVPEK